MAENLKQVTINFEIRVFIFWNFSCKVSRETFRKELNGQLFALRLDLFYFQRVQQITQVFGNSIITIILLLLRLVELPTSICSVTLVTNLIFYNKFCSLKFMPEFLAFRGHLNETLLCQVPELPILQLLQAKGDCHNLSKKLSWSFGFSLDLQTIF